jgi:hypothetical protein
MIGELFSQTEKGFDDAIGFEVFSFNIDRYFSS